MRIKQFTAASLAVLLTVSSLPLTSFAAGLDVNKHTITTENGVSKTYLDLNIAQLDELNRINNEKLEFHVSPKNREQIDISFHQQEIDRIILPNAMPVSYKLYQNGYLVKVWDMRVEQHAERRAFDYTATVETPGRQEFTLIAILGETYGNLELKHTQIIDTTNINHIGRYNTHTTSPIKYLYNGLDDQLDYRINETSSNAIVNYDVAINDTFIKRYTAENLQDKGGRISETTSYDVANTDSIELSLTSFYGRDNDYIEVINYLYAKPTPAKTIDISSVSTQPIPMTGFDIEEQRLHDSASNLTNPGYHKLTVKWQNNDFYDDSIYRTRGQRIELYENGKLIAEEESEGGTMFSLPINEYSFLDDYRDRIFTVIHYVKDNNGEYKEQKREDVRFDIEERVIRELLNYNVFSSIKGNTGNEYVEVFTWLMNEPEKVSILPEKYIIYVNDQKVVEKNYVKATQETRGAITEKLPITAFGYGDNTVKMEVVYGEKQQYYVMTNTDELTRYRVTSMQATEHATENKITITSPYETDASSYQLKVNDVVVDTKPAIPGEAYTYTHTGYGADTQTITLETTFIDGTKATSTRTITPEEVQPTASIVVEEVNSHDVTLQFNWAHGYYFMLDQNYSTIHEGETMVNRLTLDELEEDTTYFFQFTVASPTGNKNITKEVLVRTKDRFGNQKRPNLYLFDVQNERITTNTADETVIDFDVINGGTVKVYKNGVERNELVHGNRIIDTQKTSGVKDYYEITIEQTIDGVLYESNGVVVEVLYTAPAPTPEPEPELPPVLPPVEEDDTNTDDDTTNGTQEEEEEEEEVTNDGNSNTNGNTNNPNNNNNNKPVIKPSSPSKPVSPIVKPSKPSSPITKPILPSLPAKPNTNTPSKPNTQKPGNSVIENEQEETKPNELLPSFPIINEQTEKLAPIELTSVLTTGESIQFKWKKAKEEGAIYIIKRGNKVIYEGTNTTFMDKGLQFNKTYNYTFAVQANGQEATMEAAAQTARYQQIFVDEEALFYEKLDRYSGGKQFANTSFVATEKVLDVLTKTWYYKVKTTDGVYYVAAKHVNKITSQTGTITSVEEVPNTQLSDKNITDDTYTPPVYQADYTLYIYMGLAVLFLMLLIVYFATRRWKE